MRNIGRDSVAVKEFELHYHKMYMYIDNFSALTAAQESLKALQRAEHGFGALEMAAGSQLVEGL